MKEFEVLHRDGLGRIGRFPTPHGPITTPALLPVVHPDPGRQAIPPREIRRQYGIDAVITSSYIAWRTPELRARAEEVGIHGLIDFDGPVMTDSGAFQQHAYGSVEVGPEAILAFQGRIGTDIATVLDIFIEPEADRPTAEQGVAVTAERARLAREHRAGLLAVPVQGGAYPDLRQRSALAGAEIADVQAIGGVVPLLERYRFAELARVLVGAREGLAPEHPVHLFGTGHPLSFAFAALLGVDLFDSAAYHKFARRDALLFPEGTVALKTLREPICGCVLCARQPLETLAERPASEREPHIARHNLWMCALEIRRVRQAIRDGTLWELAERRAAAHPALIAGLRGAVRGARVLVPAEPVVRASFRATSPISTLRPGVIRFLARLRNYRSARGAYRLGRRIPLTPGGLRHRPTESADGEPIQWECRTPIGPVPLELTELYPIGVWLGADDFEPDARDAEEPDPEEIDRSERDWTEPWTRRQFASLLEWQFGPEAAEGCGDLAGRRSPRSGRLRDALGPRGAAFTFGHGGVPRPTWIGAERLHRLLPYPRARIVVDPDAVPFVEAGRSLFSAFVRGGDSSLAPEGPALLVDPEDRLLAVGRLLLAPYEMARLRRGVAVRVTAHAHEVGGHAPEEEPAAAGDEDPRKEPPAE